MLSLLELSLTGGVFILAVVVVRALAMNRLPRQAFLLLWAVALARLLLPFSIPSPTSLYSAAGHLGEGFRRAEDPSFSGQLSRTETANVYGDTVEVGWTEAGYSFTYRILDQDGLTVAERDAFLQSILKGMQDCLDDLSTESLRDEGKLKQTLQAELDRLGAAAATGQIAYTGGAVEGCWSEAAYDGSGTLVTHDLVVEGMA